ncbi:GNAT family N-acetyltransferase [Solicola gregarius]|uniref:GNAT family N-acetyltransferase n=1 Tax=Solicola gregarius TaxID=2908642 RepID=A0AA46TKJ2_9ACTN|nr:GNAT family protein [Solicola gregarius]UYM06813.1 GNAT family N-acetyltransferase [Solicola gregarius]
MTTDPTPWHEAPDLDGSRVRLTRVRPEHAAGLFTAADDDAVFTWLSNHRPRDLGDAERHVADSIEAADRGTRAVWTQIDTASGEVAGSTSYYDIDATLRTVAIGYTWLGRRFQRTGVNTESKLLLLERAFDTLGAVRVVWHTDALNAQSRAAIERLGATFEGILRKHKPRKDGSWRDTAQYAMTDDDWPEAGAALRARLR